MSQYFAKPQGSSAVAIPWQPTPMRLAVDCGHGYTKALSSTGERLLFPSLICPAPPQVDLGEWGRSDGVTIDGQRFLLGEAARRYAAPLWSRDKATDGGTLQLILAAAAQLGAVGPVHLATGLPVSWFGTQRQAFRDALRGAGATVGFPGHPPQRLWIDRVTVLPQAAAGALAALTGPVLQPELWLDLDVGYRTTDYLILSRHPARPIDIAPSGAGSLELGMHAVTQDLVQHCEQTFGLAFAESELEGAEAITIRGDRVRLDTLRAPALAALAARIRDELRLRLGDQLDRLDGLLVLGGGGQALYPFLQQVFPQSRLGDDAQWANAQGYLSAL